MEKALTNEPPRDDAQLMAAIAAGDMAALGELVIRHQTKVLALAIRTLGSRELAQDVAQDVFIRIYGAAKTYRPEAKFTTWLYRIVVNRCLDVMRRNKRPIVPLEAETPTTTDSTATSRIEQLERAGRIRQAVRALPERQRIAVILHRFQGLTHRGVAEATGWSESAVESLLVRAYTNLRRSLADLRITGK